MNVKKLNSLTCLLALDMYIDDIPQIHFLYAVNNGGNDGLYTIGQTLRIRVGPLKGYLCRVIAIRRSDVTVKLDSQQKVLTGLFMTVLLFVFSMLVHCIILIFHILVCHFI